MHVNQISILALQETHLKTEKIDKLNDKYRYLKFDCQCQAEEF